MTVAFYMADKEGSKTIHFDWRYHSKFLNTNFEIAENA